MNTSIRDASRKAVQDCLRQCLHSLKGIMIQPPNLPDAEKGPLSEVERLAAVGV